MAQPRPISLRVSRTSAHPALNRDDWIVVYPCCRGGYVRLVRDIELSYCEIAKLIRDGVLTADDPLEGSRLCPPELLDRDR